MSHLPLVKCRGRGETWHPRSRSLSKAGREKLLGPEAQVPGRQAVARLEGLCAMQRVTWVLKAYALSTPCRVTCQAAGKSHVAGVCTCMCVLQRRRDWVCATCHDLSLVHENLSCFLSHHVTCVLPNEKVS